MEHMSIWISFVGTLVAVLGSVGTATVLLIRLIRSLDARFAGIDARFAHMETRTDRLESTLTTQIHDLESSLTARIDSVETGLTARIDSIETGLTARIDSVETGLTARIDALSTRTDGLEASLTAYMESTNAAMATLGARVDRLADTVTGLDRLFDTRLTAVETDLHLIKVRLLGTPDAA